MPPLFTAPPGLEKKHPSTFHITESDQILGHLPSKNDLFFEALRPHAAVVRQILRHKGRKISSPHLPYHRVEPFLPPFDLKKRGSFSIANSPHLHCPPSARYRGKNVPLYSISPSWTTFVDIYPQKKGVKKEGRSPFWAIFPSLPITARSRRRPMTWKSCVLIPRKVDMREMRLYIVHASRDRTDLRLRRPLRVFVPP